MVTLFSFIKTLRKLKEANEGETPISVKVSWPLLTTPQTKFE